MKNCEPISWMSRSYTSAFLRVAFLVLMFCFTSLPGRSGTNPAALKISTHPAPTVSVNSPTICSGESATLTATSAQTGLSYLWLPAGSSGSVYIVSPSATQIYTLIASLAGETSTISATVTVTGTVMPLVTFSYPPACRDTLVKPAAGYGFSSGGTYRADSLDIDSSGRVNTMHMPPGSYLVTYSFPASGCTVSASHTAVLTILGPPSLTVSPDVMIRPGSGTTLSAVGGLTYTWSPAENMSCANCPVAIVSPLYDTRYCVVAENAGCEAKACIHVAVGCTDSDFSAPNAFSPNADGYNDLFCLPGWKACVDKFTVLIFDRWGEKVYESGDALFCWDGYYKGKLLEPEVYVFSVSGVLKNGREIHKKGSLTLLH